MKPGAQVTATLTVCARGRVAGLLGVPQPRGKGSATGPQGGAQRSVGLTSRPAAESQLGSRSSWAGMGQAGSFGPIPAGPP